MTVQVNYVEQEYKLRVSKPRRARLVVFWRKPYAPWAIVMGLLAAVAIIILYTSAIYYIVGGLGK
jgi:hypothetical protein